MIEPHENYHPTGSNLLVRLEPAEDDVTENGIILPGGKQVQRGVILRAGKDVEDDSLITQREEEDTPHYEVAIFRTGAAYIIAGSVAILPYSSVLCTEVFASAEVE